MSYRGIRRRFIDYFLKHDHVFVPSSSVIPSFNDRSCLFVNAGMFQFKNQLLGLGVNDRSPVRVTNSQKCVRISGKHNDIDEVGGDGHHHTFFEMLGNWSFGDYFNEEACHMALDLLVNHYKLPLSRLYFTFYGGGNKVPSDLKTSDIWTSLGVPPNQIISGHLVRHYSYRPKTDNFWEMGSTGPCGPCTEIFYDINGVLQDGQQFSPKHIDLLEEIWNIVMIKFNKVSEGNLTPLGTNHIDTGLGFERIVKILEDKQSNYDTSLFAPLVQYLQDESNAQVKLHDCSPRERRAFFLVLDHMRALTITLTDGANFSAGGRGPPLKQLMKRAAWFSEHVLGVKELNWDRVVDIMAETYDDIFPEIGENKERTAEALMAEHRKSSAALYQVEKSLLNKIHKGQVKQTDIQFFHESKGLPFQVAKDICDAHDVDLNWKSVMKLQVYAAPKNPNFSNFGSELTGSLSHVYPAIKERMQSLNVNCTQLMKDVVSLDDAKVICIVQNSEIASGEVSEGKVAVVLDKTCFYPAKPGHSSDVGTILCDGLEIDVSRVELLNDVIVHHGHLNFDSIGLISQSEETFSVVRLRIDCEKRAAVSRAHAALMVTLHCLARELGLKNSELPVTETQVGPDRCIAHIGHGNDLADLTPKNVAETSSSIQQFVAQSHTMKSENWPKKWQELNLDSLDKDTMCFDTELSPYHRTVCYPATGFRYSNSALQSLENSSTSPVIFSAAPFPDLVSYLDVIDILDFKKTKNGIHKLVITSGPIAKELNHSMHEVSRKLQTEVYILKNKREQEKALREIADGLLLPFRFRWLLKQKKLVVKTEASTANRYLGLFKEPESFL